MKSAVHEEFLMAFGQLVGSNLSTWRLGHVTVERYKGTSLVRATWDVIGLVFDKGGPEED